jgi:hypothetical protein
MYAYELGKVTKKMHRLIKKGKLKEKEICLFGVSENTRQIIKILRENGYEPKYVIDNDTNKIGSYCSGIHVTDASEFRGNSNTICLLYSFYREEMERQLIQIGMKAENIIDFTSREINVIDAIFGIQKGKKLYEKLVRKYGDVPIFLCPYTGTGDIYLIGTFWEEYIRKKNIKQYIFVVISQACKKVAQLFDIKNIVCLKNQKGSAYLISYYASNTDNVKLKILNDAWAQINDNQTEWFRGYKGWYFTELFRKFVFDLPDDSKPRHPVLKDKEKDVEALFSQNGLRRGKTAVLSPYSNTLSDLPLDFWEKLCVQLKEKGYTVCTNSSGPTEPPVKGSVGIFFPLNIAPQFVNAAGMFIGVRSGFCDIISGCKAKKIILYDKGNRFYNCSAFEYFSLNKMELCDDAIEIEFESGLWKKILDLIDKYEEG